MDRILLVALGGALGSVARYLTGVQTGRVLGVTGGPFGPATATFIVNIVGGFVMGLLIGWLAFRGGEMQERWRLLIGVGMLGGFTTFSSFSLEVVQMLERRTYGLAAAYVGLSVLLAVTAVFAGLVLMRRVFA